MNDREFAAFRSLSAQGAIGKIPRQDDNPSRRAIMSETMRRLLFFYGAGGTAAELRACGALFDCRGRLLVEHVWTTRVAVDRAMADPEFLARCARNRING